MSSKVLQFGPKAHAFIMQPPEKDRKYTILVGSVRSSKTWACTAKLIVHLCRYNVDGRRMIFGKNKGSIYKNILIDLFEIVGKENYSYNQQSGELWLFGKQFFCMGAQDEGAAASILGMTIGIAVCDEIVKYPRSFVMQLFLRMSPTGSRLYATTNPDNPYHYLKTEVIDNPKFAPDLTVLEFTLDDNPNIDEDEKRRIKASQVGVFYLRFILGRWVAAEGAIYRDCWSDSLLYLPEQNESIYGWGGYVDHLIFVDYGTANPCTFLEAIDDGRKLHIDRQYWWDSAAEARQKTDAQYADDLQAWLSTEGYKDSNGIVSISRVMRRSQPRIVLDPSAASLRVELSSRGFWVVDADNEVVDGIRKVSSVMSKGLLAVNKECENLIREIPAYTWDPEGLKVGEEKPIKSNDHGCLVAGTPVLTRDGWHSVDQILPGAQVLTRQGFKPVLAAEQTSVANEIFTISLSNGAEFSGTGNHPVWVKGKGFERIDALRYGDILESWENSSYLTGFDSTAIQNLSGALTGFTSPLMPAIEEQESAGCMKRFGRRRMGRFQISTTSTIKTGIRSTTNWTTLSACRTKSILRSTMKRRANGVRVQPNWRVSQNSGLLRSLGTVAQRDEHGTESRQRLRLPMPSLSSSSAITAGKITKAFREVETLSAGTIASQHSAGTVVATMRLENVSSAGQISQSISTNQSEPVPVRVLDVKRVRRSEPVYNLKVEGCPEYFAAGVLMHNCDALRYGIKEVFTDYRLLAS